MAKTEPTEMERINHRLWLAHRALSRAQLSRVPAAVSKCESRIRKLEAERDELAAAIRATPEITVQQIEDGGTGTLRARQTMFVAHGPDGHTWLLKRLTADAARRDGLAYFLGTRTLRDGRWEIGSTGSTKEIR